MAYFNPESFTVSQPGHDVADYDFGHFFDQPPSQPSPEAGGGPGGPGVRPGGGPGVRPGGGPDISADRDSLAGFIQRGSAVTAEEQQAWMYASLGVLYYAFPVQILWGVASGFLSLITLIRLRKNSNDTYLIGFTLASLLLLICASLLRVQDYMAHNNDYQRLLGYIKTANDWLWCTALWLLVVMTLERALTLIQNRSKNFCSAVQASVITLVIFVVCLISVLPEFWEFEAIETFDYVTNRTLVISALSQTADSPEYKIMYFWYSVTILVLLPYPIMIAMIVLLAKLMRKSRHSKKRLSASVQRQSAAALNRRLSEDVHLTRLHIALILLYVLLSGPLTFLVIVNGITPYWTWPVHHLYTGLYPIFEFVFYFYFSIQLLLYLTYYDKFRRAFLRTFCCCCPCTPCRKLRKREIPPAALPPLAFSGSPRRQTTPQHTALYTR